MVEVQSCVHPDDIGTIGREGIVKLWLFLKAINFHQVIQQHPPPVSNWSSRSVEVHIFRGSFR